MFLRKVISKRPSKMAAILRTSLSSISQKFDLVRERPNEFGKTKSRREFVYQAGTKRPKC
jgi:hypothetical protein